MLTYSQVKKVLNYSQETGLLGLESGAKRKVGSKTKTGYIEIGILNKRMYAHRLAWLLTHKEWPKGQIDHINGVRDDNRIDNLRLVTNRENHQNMKKHKGNSSGATGIYWNKRAKKWQAYICVDYKQIYLGIFKVIEDAETARKNAEIKYGFHKNHGRE